tara:strand:+ start:1864 stop:2466 length:603 start_codon:yes stop_codon:yes gene_type:complete
MNCWARTEVDTANSLKIDLKDYILSNPYRPGEHALYVPEAGGIWTLQPKTLFTDEWLEHITDEYGVKVDMAQIFFRKPHYQHPGAHVDIDQNNNLYGGGLNWTLDPDDADMVWYNMPSVDPVYTKRSETDRNKEWPLDSLTEHARCNIGQTPTLVRTDIPHTVQMGENERWLISVRFTWLSSWDQYVNAFGQWIKDETLV